MITEDYVGFETAKLMKEKGFDLSEFHGKWAIDYDNIPRDEDTPEGEIIIAEWQYPLITLQMAMKWLREKHDIFIEISVDNVLKDKGYQWALYYNSTKEITPYADWENSYEEACEAAIKYCLENLI